MNCPNYIKFRAEARISRALQTPARISYSQLLYCTLADSAHQFSQFPASWSEVQRVRLSRKSCMISVESL
eukprot:symbB.v1.2.025188.t1/scaffold2433.1/size79213/2